MNISRRRCLNLLLCPLVSGCVGRVIDAGQNLYSRPHALEVPPNEYYDRFEIRILGKFILAHDWPSSQDPPRWSLKNGPKYFSSESRNGGLYFAHDIQEWDEATWAATVPPRRMDPYVRERYSVPVYKTITSRAANGSLRFSKGEFMGMQTYTGFSPIGRAFWGSSAHHIDLNLRRCSIQEWLDRMVDFAEGAFFEPGAQRTTERIGKVDWHVFTVQPRPRRPNYSSGPFEHRFAQIGDTPYTIALTMGATSESLQFPQRHALVQRIFRHLTETLTVTRVHVPSIS